MPYLVDTNVISEVARSDADAHVKSWLSALASTEVFLSVLTLGEIGRGVALLAESRRKQRLRAWLSQDLPTRFRGRILPIDVGVAEAWGILDAQARLDGRPLPAVDGLILATAHAHDLTLATRNVRDCGGRGVPVVDPWEPPGR